MKTKNINYRKLVFYLSLSPYIITLIMIMISSVFGYYLNYSGDTVYGLRAAEYIFFDFWSLVIPPSALGWIVIICFFYQVYYFISTLGNKVVLFKGKKGIKIKQIFLYLSLAVFAMYLITGIHAYFYGYTITIFFNTSTTYGIDGFLNALFWNGLIFSIVPILPIALIYIIVYFFNRKKVK